MSSSRVPDPPVTVSIPRAADMLGISYWTARNWIAAGKFPAQIIQIGPLQRVRTADLEAILAGKVPGDQSEQVA